MASASRDLRSHVTDVVTCPICQELFNSPKSLPCLHTFCLKCIEGHCRDIEPGDEVACPMCRQKFNIPVSGVAGLVSNFFIAGLVEARKTASDVVVSVPCEVCVDHSDGGNVPASTMHCVDCDQKLCERCSRPHRKMKGGPHNVVPMGNDVDTKFIQPSYEKCVKHNTKHQKLFCLDSNVNICVMCSSDEHQQHKWNNVEACLKQIDADVGQIRELAAGAHNEISRLDEQRRKFLTHVDEVLENIVERGAELKQLIDKQVNEHKTNDAKSCSSDCKMNKCMLRLADGQEIAEKILERGEVVKQLIDKQVHRLVADVQMLRVETRKEIDSHKENVEMKLVAFETFSAYCSELKSKGKPCDITRAANGLHNRATELLQNDVTVDYCAPDVTFSPTNIQELHVGLQNLVGVVGPENKSGCQTLGITSSGRNDSSTQHNLEQKHTACLTENLDKKNIQSAPVMTTLKPVIGDAKITHKEYSTVTKIIQTPAITDSSTSEEKFRSILPYIRQRVKMRGCHVLQPFRITALLSDETKPLFSVISDPFQQTSTQQQVTGAEKAGSCPLSRLDLITCLLNSADDIVKSDLLSNMAQFPMALPLVMRNNEEEPPYSINASCLYGLRVKWETGSGDIQRIVEHSIFRDKYRLIVAVRLGNNHTGKSTILNQLFAKEHMFSSVKEPGARYGKPLSLDGSVEMVWLTRETCKDNFWSTISKFYSDAEEPAICLLANLHGDATEFPETIRVLSEIFSCMFLVFICNDCECEKWTNFQQRVGKERIANIIRVDPTDNQSHSLNDIQTSQIVGDETQEKIRQIISNVLESCVPAMYVDKLTCMETGTVALPLKMETAESQSLVAFVEEQSCKTVKEKMKLQMQGYSKASEDRKRRIFKSYKRMTLEESQNSELPPIIKRISGVLNLPFKSLQRAMIHLEKELVRLSDIASRRARDESSKIRNQLKAEKMKGNNKQAISNVKAELNSALKEIGDNYLAVEHLLREIGCVHEVLQSHPDITSIHRNVADLFINGQSIELVDGDADDIPEFWLKSIFGVVEKKFPNLRVFVVSVIGLQSSGKSTLLNTLFACRFPVSVGRCSRGLFMRLLFLERELVETRNFDAILLIDSEGLVSPEKMNDPEAAKRDRQMATFVMSISNLTLINVLGENMVEMAAILQIAIIALTRIQVANISPDIMMIQCLTGEKNLEKTAAGRDSFTAAISAALECIRTKGIHVGAKSSECLRALKRRIEDGNMLFQLRSYKDGATANAPPSEVYHEDAVELYKTILECGKHSLFIFSTWYLLVTESWTAAGRENFASRFEDIKAVIEYIDRMERIAQCKRSIDNVFYVHERQLKESVEQKVNNVTIDELRNNAKETFLKSIEEKLKVIPRGCQDNDKCTESCNQTQLLYESIYDQRLKADIVRSINDHMTRIRESAINMLRKKFDAEIVKRGCSEEFDSRISESTMRHLTAHGMETDSEQIAVNIFQELKTIATKMERPIPIAETFVADLITVYNVFPEMGQTFQSSLTCEMAVLQNWDDKRHDLQYLTHGNRKQVFDDSLSRISRELQYLKNRLGALPEQIITKASAECYDYRIMAELKNEVEKEFKNFQNSNDKLCNDINEMLLHIWVQRVLLECVKTQHKKWDEKTNPVSVLKAAEETYKVMIKTRLDHGFGYKSEGIIMAGHIANAIKLRATEKVDHQIVDIIKNQPWTTSSVLLRIRYFAELALKLKKGDKHTALSHFLDPEESIKNWFAKKIDTEAPEKAKKLFETNIKTMCEDAIKDLQTVHKMKDILRIVKSYYGAYSPAKQVDLTTTRGEHFDMLKSALLKTLDSLSPTTFSLEHKLSENMEIKKCFGCTHVCFWCGAFCWFDVGHGNEHSTSHQPQGLRGIRNTTTKRLQAEPCHETKDDQLVYWGKFYEKGMPWGQAKSEHFSDWTFMLFKEKKFDDLMRWFFQELHTDIAKQRSTSERPLEPASDNELEEFGCKGLHFSTILTALRNDLTSFKDDPFIKELNEEIQTEQMQLISSA